MIQFKRGTTKSWLDQTEVLADGQPGYDKTKRKLKIGDGEHSWKNLPYVSGLFAEEILREEAKAESDTLFTYGEKIPDSKTKGEVYLQKFDGAIEVDYVVETGRNINYFFRKWNSGFIECWGNGEIPNKDKMPVETVIFSVKTDDYFEIKGFWK